MIRVSQHGRSDGAREPQPYWARRTGVPMAMVLAWIAALVITTEGLMTWQNLYG